MHIVFFSRNKDLPELIAPLSDEKYFFWYGTKLPEIHDKTAGIIFFDYDDSDFNLESFYRIISADLQLSAHFLKVLISSNLSVKAFKKLQEGNKYIDGLLRSPIKLKDIETFVDDYKLVQSETRQAMSDPKTDEIVAKISAKNQAKFDLVFSNDVERKDLLINSSQSGEDSSMKSAKPAEEVNSPTLDLDFEGTGSFEFEKSSSAQQEQPKTSSSSPKLEVVKDDNDLEFTLDFGDDQDIPSVPDMEKNVSTSSSPEAGGVSVPAPSNFDGGFELDAMFDGAIEEAQNSLSEGTQKTILFNPAQLLNAEEDVTRDIEISPSAENMSTEEASANIESTIKDIIRPVNSESTQEFAINITDEPSDLSEMSIDAAASSKSSDLEFSLENEATDSRDISNFDLSPVEFLDQKISGSTNPPKNMEKEDHSFDLQEEEERSIAPISSQRHGASTSSPASMPTNYEGIEETSRVHATIRQLREEREDLLNQIKMHKVEHRELEQDNLTLKAALDEAKIEVSILRKRHMVELEDMRYRLSVNEEKKLQAQEMAKQAIAQKEKLEQRVRIDFNQVKLREKELETKLEMLVIDVDSQVQSRDQKILELRRKIDSLEFNMENVSIREHKSLDDKRKLEDKLNKIMKTLRNSIKNLEEDIDQVADEAQDDRQKPGNRSGKL